MREISRSLLKQAVYTFTAVSKAADDLLIRMSRNTTFFRKKLSKPANVLTHVLDEILCT